MSSSKKTTYKRLNDIDHVLLRGGMYIGSAETITDNFWIYDNDTKHITWKKSSRKKRHARSFSKLKSLSMVSVYQYIQLLNDY
jgi:hypothetical protein